MTVGVVTVETFPPLQILLSTQAAPLLSPSLLPLSGLGPLTSTFSISSDLSGVDLVSSSATFLYVGAKISGGTEIS